MLRTMMTDAQLWATVQRTYVNSVDTLNSFPLPHDGTFSTFWSPTPCGDGGNAAVNTACGVR